ncbi:MAG TPA: FAD-dependent oxidoreductase [Rhodospirillaceae bacterium]|nr:MAG: hypothetical protein A2018_05490 [Alphaproteobacteria bacterium GWF2_58_20]HAU28968.1 FAD-dependent oxidoreductase [Rhodospirillaceae bacterium]
MENAPIVVVGSGMAGITVIREFRKLDQNTPVVLITEDDGCHYSKPMISNALMAGKRPGDLVLSTKEALVDQMHVVIHANTRAEHIMPDAHLLGTSKGYMPYRKLILALGATPLRLPLQGEGVHNVLSVNNLIDYVRWTGKLTPGQDIAIIGAGLVGCEFACDLAATGHHVRVFDIAPQPLYHLLPPQAADFFRKKLAAGISFSLGCRIIRIDQDGDAYTLVDDIGSTHRAHLVLSAVGLVPSTGLARDAGLATRCGIIADRTLRTSDPDIFTLGDCAEVEGMVLPYVMPIMQAARSIAASLASIPPVPGAPLYPAMPIVVKTPACPAVVCLPPLGKGGDWHETATPEGFRAIFEDDSGRMSGFALVGDAVQEKQELLPKIPAWL